jgi:hypothetical protein
VAEMVKVIVDARHGEAVCKFFHIDVLPGEAFVPRDTEQLFYMIAPLGRVELIPPGIRRTQLEGTSHPKLWTLFFQDAYD